MWNMRTEFAAVLIGVVVAGATPSFVAAQQQPKPFPWENNANKLLNRGIPEVENPIHKRIDRGAQITRPVDAAITRYHQNGLTVA